MWTNIILVCFILNLQQVSGINKSTLNILHLTSTYGNWHSEANMDFVISLVNSNDDILPDYHIKQYTYMSEIVSRISLS